MAISYGNEVIKGPAKKNVTSGGGKKSSSPSLWSGIKHIPGDIAKVQAAPFFHLPTILKALEAEATRLPKARFREGGIEFPTATRSAKTGKLSYDWGKEADWQKARAGGWGQALRNLQAAPVTAYLPGVQTGALATTPEGRQELKEHPSVAVMDAAAFVAPYTKAGSVAGKLATAAAGNPLRAVGVRPLSMAGKGVTRLVEKTPTGRALTTGIANKTATVRSMLPSTRTSKVAAIPRAVRAVDKMISDDATGELHTKLGSLSTGDRDILRRALYSDRVPKAPHLKEAYSLYRERVEQMAAEKLAANLSDAAVTVLRDKVVARTSEPLTRQLGPDRSKRMLDAFMAGADNPYPELSKPWNRLRKLYDRTVDQETAKVRLQQAVDTGEVFPVAQARKLDTARRRYERGELDQAAYYDLITKNVPARFRPALEPYEKAKARLRERLQYEKGFGQKAYATALAELEASLDSTWTQLAAKGVSPAFVSRRALGRFEQAPDSLSVHPTTRTPSSLKQTKAVAEKYADDPVAMLFRDEMETTRNVVVSEAVADVYNRTGGKAYSSVFDDYTLRGYTPEQANKMIEANFRSFDLSGEVGAPKPGDLLIRRDVAKSMEMYLKQAKPGFADKFLQWWITPVLYMAPAFHVNNIIGGAVFVGSKQPAALRYMRQAYKMVRGGDLPTEIPTGAVMTPAYRKFFTAAEDEGVSLLRKVARTPKKAIEFSAKMNEFFDGMYRAMSYLDETSRAGRKGMSPTVAHEAGVKAASNLLQNWDASSPLDRQILQKLMPFWGFKKTLYKSVLRYPIDHPYRMQVMRYLADDYVNQEDDLPEAYDDLAQVGPVNKDGFGRFVSTRGANPYADAADLFRLRGFLSALTPLLQQPLRAIGVDTQLGGVPAYGGDREWDPETGRWRRKFKAAELIPIPQLQAVAQSIGVVKGLPAPENDSESAWMHWAKRYWSRLRLPFTPSYRNVEQVREEYIANRTKAEELVEQSERDADDVGTKTRINW